MIEGDERLQSLTDARAADVPHQRGRCEPGRGLLRERQDAEALTPRESGCTVRRLASGQSGVGLREELVSSGGWWPRSR
jgi:hypothetical protein